MIQKYFRFTNLNLLAVLLLSFFSTSSYAATFYIDNFTDTQSVIDLAGDSTASTSTQALTLAGSNLGSGTQRTLSIDAAGTASAPIFPGFPAFNSLIQSNTGTLQISNNATVTSAIASIFWNGFNPVDLTTYGTGLLLKVNSIDLATTIQLIVNGGASQSTAQVFAAGSGNFFVPFATGFSDASVFNNISDIKLVFSGTGPWDGQFSFLVATVPEPSVLILMFSAFLTINFISKYRNKELKTVA